MKSFRRFQPALLQLQPYLLVTLVFVVSRWAYRNIVGIEFDSTPIDFFIQYIDPWFFENHFWQSLLYLHHQAPLQNLLVGGSLRVFGEARGLGLLEGLYALLGFGTTFGLLHAMLRLGVVRPIATLVAAAYGVAPATVVYENWLFYHQPVCFLLVLSLLALIRYHRVKSFGSALGLFSALALLGLFRNTFGPLFLAAVLLFLLLRPPLGVPISGARRALLRAAAVPLAVLCLNSLKPWVLTGHSYGSSMLWGNLSGKIRNELPPPELARLLEQGAVSRTATLFMLTDLREFGDSRIAHPPTGVPLLDLERAPSGRWNAHALEYLLITRKFYEPETKYLLAHYPDVYLRSVARALVWYTGSSLDDSMLPSTQNYQRVQKLNAPLDRLFIRREDRQWLLLIGLPLLLVYAGSRLLGSRARLASQHGSFAVIALASFVIAYLSGAYLLISSGDFSRYRVEVDPFFVLLTALLSNDVLHVLAAYARALRRRLARRATVAAHASI